MTDISNDIDTTFDAIVANFDAPIKGDATIITSKPVKRWRVLRTMPKSKLRQAFNKPDMFAKAKPLPSYKPNPEVPVLEGLLRVQKLIETGWVQSSMVGITEDNQMGVCLVGAVRRSYGSTSFSTTSVVLNSGPNERAVYGAIYRQIPQPSNMPGPDASPEWRLAEKLSQIYHFNDHVATSKRQVLAIVRKAIRAERKRLAA